MVRANDLLKRGFAGNVWRNHGTKFRSTFCLELKKAKLDEYSREELRPFVTVNQGEHRLAYTEADNDLMTKVLTSMRSALRASRIVAICMSRHVR